ncbi:ATP binding [Saitoella coloradoensis]
MYNTTTYQSNTQQQAGPAASLVAPITPLRPILSSFKSELPPSPVSPLPRLGQVNVQTTPTNTNTLKAPRLEFTPPPTPSTEKKIEFRSQGAQLPITPPATPTLEHQQQSQNPTNPEDPSTFSSTFLASYTPTHVLGRGGFGFVMSCTQHRTSTPVAVKFINRAKIPKHAWINDRDLGMVPMEIHILSRVDHGGVVRALDFFEDERWFYLVMELVGSLWVSQSTSEKGKSSGSWAAPSWPLKNPFFSKKTTATTTTEDKATLAPPPSRPQMIRRTSHDLFETIEQSPGGLTESQARHIMRQVIDTVAYLDNLNIVHRDIKDENIVCDDELNVKLIDFGSAIILPPHKEGDGGARFTKFYGTMNFAAPEILQKRPYDPRKTEVWALGCLLYTCLVGEVPFPDPYAALDRTWRIPRKRVSRECLELLGRMLERDEGRRCGLGEVLGSKWWGVEMRK